MDTPLQLISLPKGPTDVVILTRGDIAQCGLRDSIDVASYKDIRLVAQGLMPRPSFSRMNSAHASGNATPIGESNFFIRRDDGMDRDALDEHMLSSLPESCSDSGSNTSRSCKVRKGLVKLKSDQQLLMESKSRQRTNKDVIVSAIELEMRKDLITKQRNAIFPATDSISSTSFKQSSNGNGGSFFSRNPVTELPREVHMKMPQKQREYGNASGILSLAGRPFKLR